MTATSLRQEALAGMADLQARYPRQFGINWRRRLPAIVIPLLVVALAGYSFVALDFSLARLWAGANRLGFFIALMFPPDPGPRLVPMLQAMAETLAIAFLGTLVAAVLAFSIRAARRQERHPQHLRHFGTRRVFDVIRSIDVLIWALMWISVVASAPSPASSRWCRPISAASASCFRRRSRRPTARPPKASLRRAARASIRSVSACCRRSSGHRQPGALLLRIEHALGHDHRHRRRRRYRVYLSEAIRVLELKELGFIILMILVVVSVIDFVSTRLRLAIIGRQKIET